MRNKTVDKVNNRHKGLETGEHRMCLQTSLWSTQLEMSGSWGLSWQKGKLGAELAEGAEEETQVGTTSYGTLNTRLKAYVVPSNISNYFTKGTKPFNW